MVVGSVRMPAFGNSMPPLLEAEDPSSDDPETNDRTSGLVGPLLALNRSRAPWGFATAVLVLVVGSAAVYCSGQREHRSPLLNLISAAGVPKQHAVSHGKASNSTITQKTTTSTSTTMTTTTTELICPEACSPGKRVVPDIVIPFFERDLCKLKYTAQSLGAHDPQQNLGDVYLMWVSNNPASDYKEDLAEVTQTLLQSRKVNLLDFSVAMKSYDLDGWHAQQLLKLKIASVINSEFYLVMDSKNTLIKDIEADTFFNKCNEARVFAQYNYTKIPSPHSAWYQKAAETLGVEPPLDIPFPASITPILLHRETVLNMLAHIGEGSSLVKLCDGPLCSLFGVGDASGQGTTEFTMYNMFSFTKTKLSCLARPELHDPDSKDQWGLSLWRGVAENKEQVMKENIWTLQNITLGILQPIMFGSQPSALDDLSDKQRKKAEKMLEQIYNDAGVYNSGDKSIKELIDCAIGSYEYGKNEKKFN